MRTSKKVKTNTKTKNHSFWECPRWVVLSFFVVAAGMFLVPLQKTLGDGDNVVITDVSVVSDPAGGDTYIYGEKIMFEVTFNRAVTVRGDVFVHFFIGGKWQGARHKSGSGTEVLGFSYTVQTEDRDTNGILIGGTGKEIIGVGPGASVRHNDIDAQRTFSSHIVWKDLPGHKVNGNGVGIIDVSVVSAPDEGDTYIYGEKIMFEVTFNKSVTVRGDVFVHFFIGGRWQGARHKSGSGTRVLRFSYTVQTEDRDTNGILIGGTGKEIIGVGPGASVRHNDIDAQRIFFGHIVWKDLSEHKVDGPLSCGDHECTAEDCNTNWEQSQASKHCPNAILWFGPRSDGRFFCSIISRCAGISGYEAEMHEVSSIVYCKVNGKWKLHIPDTDCDEKP